MEAKFIYLFISLLAAPSIINAQINLNCIFQVVGFNYDCFLRDLSIPDNESIVFNIGGHHQQGMSNTNVNRVVIQNSIIPFVITQFFTTFINLQEYHFTDSPLRATRVQNNAFQAANSIQEITIARTVGLTLYPNAFAEASTLQRLNLQSNNLENLPSGLLTGLGNLTTIDLSNNRIVSIVDTFLRAQTQLTSINLSNNQITRIPSTLLASNTNLITFSAHTNQIYQIGRMFLNNMYSLTSLSLAGNQCVNQNWVNIGGTGGPTKDMINQALQVCFKNYQGGDFRDFGFQLRGSVRLYDEYGNLVGQL